MGNNVDHSQKASVVSTICSDLLVQVLRFCMLTIIKYCDLSLKLPQ